MIAANFREAWWGPIVAVVPFIATSLCLSLGCVILTRSSFGWFLWLTRTLSHLFSPALLPHICWPPRELDTEGWHSQRERPGRTRYITLPLKCWRSWSKPAVISLSKPLMLNASHAPLLKRPRPQKLNFRKIHFHEWGVNHEIHENIMPRKFGAIRCRACNSRQINAKYTCTVCTLTCHTT